MPDLYDFAWVHARAKELRFGYLDLRLTVKDGRIVMAEELEARRRISLEDSRKVSQEGSR